jgi:E3 ubiquitin-protein ligase RNF5
MWAPVLVRNLSLTSSWECIYKWMESQQNKLQECPVCKAGITQENIIPIYGRGGDSDNHPKNVPNRPKGNRPEAQGNPNFVPQGTNFFGGSFHIGFGGFHFGEGFQFGFPVPDQPNDPQRQMMSRIMMLIGMLIFFIVMFF